MSTHRNRPIDGQPDDPRFRNGVCPTCGCRCQRDPDDVAKKLLQGNAGRVHKTIIASALMISVEKLEAKAKRLGFDLTLKKEPEPRGA